MVVGGVWGVSVWAGRKKKNNQKDRQGATGTLSQGKCNGAKALQKPSPGAKAPQKLSPGARPCRNPLPVPKPCRSPHLACRGGAGLAASCSRRQTSGRWGGGCFSSSRSDGGASSGGLLGLSPACSRQIRWTGFAGPGSYLRVEREMKPPEEKPPNPGGNAGEPSIGTALLSETF